jgi:hypothetical protein
MQIIWGFVLVHEEIEDLPRDGKFSSLEGTSKSLSVNQAELTWVVVP